MNKNKKTVIISLQKYNSEIVELAESLDYEVVDTYIQHRKKPDVNSYIGKGKLTELGEYLKNQKNDIELVIINGELKPSQWFTLEKSFDIEVYDRIRLILAIFEQRANKKEARLQVRLAQLQYERPFVRELIHRARSGEHPGFMAGGEYQVDDYYEMIKKQIKKIKIELESIRDERKLRRQHRHISGFYLVSLAGYTNAGKSSLLNLLSDEEVKVEGKLFSTLSTTTRKIKNEDIPILLTDTVGFIKDLPAWIINAFHSTLEEIKVADVVVLMIDVSENESQIYQKLKISYDTLLKIGVKSPIIITLNKTDQISKNKLESLINHIQGFDWLKQRELIPISVKDKYNMDKLMDKIYNSLPYLVQSTIKLPANEKTQSLISWIYEKAKIIDIKYGNFITISYSCNQNIDNRIKAKSKNIKNEFIE